MPVPVLYEDNHLLVVVKPVNVPSQGDASGDPDLLGRLKEDVKRRYGKPGKVYLGLVHRLDRPVGGVMVFARTSKAASRLASQVRERSFDKTYLAVTEGVPTARGVLEHHLLKDRERNHVRAVAEGTPNAKRAILEYEVLERAAGRALVRVALLTGRSHQVRVQFATIGHPLFGDHRYGRARGSQQQLALWSFALELEHPTRKERMRFACLPPIDREPWQELAGALSKLDASTWSEGEGGEGA